MSLHGNGLVSPSLLLTGIGARVSNHFMSKRWGLGEANIADLRLLTSCISPGSTQHGENVSVSSAFA